MAKNIIYKQVLRKIANSPDQEFEQSFFQLAYERLQEKLHNLLPFLVGFEIVNKNADGTKALGVFGFKSNNGQMIFVPAYFINGTVKGVDLMYSKNNEQFYPLNEDFAELFLKDDVTGIGDTSYEHKNDISQRVSPVKLDNLIRPPKTAAFVEWISEAEKAELKALMLAPKTASVKHTDLIEFLTQSEPLVKKAFFQIMKENDKFCESVLRFYDLEKISKALVIPQVKTAKVEPSIELLEKSHVKVASLDDDQKVKLLKQGYYLLDKRAEENKSKIGLFKYTESFSNPTESGVYTYVTAKGTLRHGLVLLAPLTLVNHVSNGKALLIDLGSDDLTAYGVAPNAIFVKPKHNIKDLSSVYSMFDDPVSAEPSFSEVYTLINEAFVSTQPFNVVATYKNDEGLRVLEIQPSFFGSDKTRPNSYFVDKPNYDTKVRKIIFTKKTGNALEYRGTTVFVPKGFKLLNISHNKCCERSEEQNHPGSLSDLASGLRADGVFPFSINSNGSEFFANVGDSKKKYPNAIKAKIGMVIDYGLSEKAANELIDSLIPNVRKEGQIKLAYTGDQIMSLRDPQAFANMLGQPTYEDHNYMEEAPRDPSYTEDPTSIGRNTMPDIQGTNEAINTANQMAEQGQKQIFDTQSIATLSKYVSPQTKTMTYMPEFISCLDKLGRMLFLTYWETEKFEEMYGRSELPDLVELLSNVFKNLGDLVIYLKRKSPELSINMAEGDSMI